MTNASNLKSNDKIVADNPCEIINVDSTQQSVCCPPADQAQWNLHPRVYLDLEENKKAKCPYCGNVFERG